MPRTRRSRKDPIRVGVFGSRRGLSFASQAANTAGLELVALCEQHEKARAKVEQQFPGIQTYADFDAMLEREDLDAVCLANYATEHAPYAIKALRRGLHVMSENIAVKTMGEAVELVRAVEETGNIYMYAENYCYMVMVQEMHHLYQSGEIGEFKYADGEYIHPMSRDETIGLSPTPNHWRNWIPATYYCTHSMGPIMYITRLRPVKVNGFVIPYDERMPLCGESYKVSDPVGMLMVQMENGGYAKLMFYGLEKHHVWYRLFGHKGNMENLRQGDSSMLAVHHEPWNREPGQPLERIYRPEFRQFHDLAIKSGHGGGDFFMLHEFAEAIRTGKAPYLDVYRGLQMSCLGLLAYKSALNNNCAYDVPSFQDPKEYAQYEGDNWSCDPADAGPGQPPPSILGPIKKSKALLKKVAKRAQELRPDWEF